MIEFVSFYDYVAHMTMVGIFSICGTLIFAKWWLKK